MVPITKRVYHDYIGLCLIAIKCNGNHHNAIALIIILTRDSRSGGGGGSSGGRGGASRESSSSTQERPSEFSRWRERQYFGPRRWLESALRDTSWDKDGGNNEGGKYIDIFIYFLTIRTIALTFCDK